MSKLIILQGAPASGKSTWAKEFVKHKTNWVRINRDDLRNMRGDYWIPSQEKLITAFEHSCLELALKDGYNVIFDSTNLNPKTTSKVETIAKLYDAEVEYKLFEAPLEVLIERDSKRPNPVGAGVITSFYNRYFK